MKLIKTANGRSVRFSKCEWLAIGKKAGWLVESAKNKKKITKSPKDHGFMDECIEKNKNKDDPGAYCAAIVDKVKGTTNWRGESKNK